ncbi:unnamed protein product [Durusdinium trenchii]|uniref:PDZ domain-containing protein n=1 Tax=Durusdinium trenchii TaxID=1381693 RepID=A0ABP0SX69_9DINO
MHQIFHLAWLGHLVVSLGQETPAPVDFEGRMTDETKDDFAALFDEDFMQMMVDCQQLAGDTCDVTGLAEFMVDVGKRLKGSIDACPIGCTHPPATCKDFWLAFESNPVALRNGCAQTGNWPGVLQVRVADERWELSVMCRMIDPGLTLERMPTCNELATMTTVNRLTLHDGGCGFATQEECISNLCDVYSQFTWRMHPRNLIPDRVRVPFDYTYVLSGCEALVPLDLYNRRAECPKRKDIVSFCSCLCPAMSGVEALGFTNCPLIVDSYLLFGRLGISNFTLDSDCEPELCDAFSSRRLQPACAETKLPGDLECIGMQIPQVQPENSPCPWSNHTGEIDIMECLNGHRCNVVTEGWYCCENHRGRAKCPAQFPVMCDTLCSGITEYCCRGEGECTARGCPVVLQREIVYIQDTTTSATTTPAGRTGGDDEGQFELRLPQGSWIWLLVLVPLAGGLAFYCYVRCKGREVQAEDDETLDTAMGMKLDKFGFFKAYKAENRERKETKPRVCIIMSELPDTRPLGLELVELRVVRVHPWGAKHGWQVGDIIVDIAGQPVNTFEELWDRIQVERNRPPVRFTVERWNVAATVEEQLAADSLDENLAAKKMKTLVEEDRERRSKSRIASKQIAEAAAAQAASNARTLGPNALPGSFGWDDEYEDDDEYSYYSDDDSRARTAQLNFPTGRFKSRFNAVFQIVEHETPAEEGRPATPGTAKEAEAEGTKPRIIIEDETKDRKKEEKAHALSKDERRSFHKDKVMFTKDAWGRAVVKVLNPTHRKDG